MKVSYNEQSMFAAETFALMATLFWSVWSYAQGTSNVISDVHMGVVILVKSKPTSSYLGLWDFDVLMLEVL